MKIITEQSLADFKFWSGGKDTADKLTAKQLESVETQLEELYPEGIEDIKLNDIFWFDRELIYQMAGGLFPKFYTIRANCGLVKRVKANNNDDVEYIENVSESFHEEDEHPYKDYEDVDDVEIYEFENTHYFRIRSRVGDNEKILYCTKDAAENLREAFGLCQIEEIIEVPENGLDDEEDWEDYEGDERVIDEFVYDEDEMWGRFDIPVYAIPRICKLALDPNDELDYYEIPESTTIRNQNYCLELDEEDVKNIDEFVADLHKAIPEGFTIDWDAVSVGSPYFEPYPAFGKAMDCVKLRVYPNNKNTED